MIRNTIDNYIYILEDNMNLIYIEYDLFIEDNSLKIEASNMKDRHSN